MSDVKVLNQWVGPLAGFLLPAVVFVLVIPRNYRVPRGAPFFNHHIIVSFLWLIFALFLLVFDVLIWTMIPIMVRAPDEDLKDWRILRSIEKVGVRYSRAEASHALAVTLVATFKPREDLNRREANDLVDDVADKICNASDVSKTKEKLRQLLGQQMSYGVQIGAPVVFYLGAYTYSIFDADSRLGDNDTAHAIAFGLWYGLIVLTATSCCCVPGLNNPWTNESIFDTPYVEKAKEMLRGFFSLYESQHPIVDAGKIGGDEKPIHPHIRSIINSKGLSLLSCVLATTAVAVIYGLAFSISYNTPRVGFGCRATTILCHGISQIVLIIFWFYHNGDDDEKTHWIKWPIYVLAALLFAFSVFVAIGGTIMQLLGVYRDCLCKAGLRFGSNQAARIVVLSSDTEEDGN
ncbi:uncharacterized protein PAC_02154 [Phialocephala subalpina]|uniref:Transmembrane protein n=1 Tax=Phialocephala subalpina TaxID=576137 RepID=A0A1L7WHP4_9HELO|nr:uncharacterized protein PAC_02154 [Phialocephala subalpina]